MITLSLGSFLRRLVESITKMPVRFADVVTHDPISAILIAMGALVMAAAVGAGAYLVLGAFFDTVSPS